MKALVTGTAGHLGEGLARILLNQQHEVVGLDIKPSRYTICVGSITNREFVRECMRGVTTVFHAATLHKPHVATHTAQQFIDTNISGTLTLLEEAVSAGVESFVFTSTTSVFGDSLVPPLAEPAAWITEEVMPLPKNIYGITKLAAENLCYNTHRKHKLPCIILRTSRFFPEDDDDATKRAAFTSNNLKTNEYLFRRVDIEDAVNAHLCAARHADSIGLGTYIVSATSPFMPEDLLDLRLNAPLVVHKYAPEYQDIYNIEGWRMSDSIDRVYINKKAMAELGWNPVFDFKKILAQVKQGAGIVSPLGAMIGSKGYHQVKFDEGPYPIDNSTFRQAC